MAARGLIDTGAMLAYLDRDNRWHERCVDAIANLRLPLATSAAVLAELFHLLRNQPRQKVMAWHLVRSPMVTVLAIDGADLPALATLMLQYADRPMDFADATLVHLARRETLTTVFTIDHDGFETYRIDGRRRFRIVPGR
jgi:predicted nucleic acid-binding protein